MAKRILRLFLSFLILEGIVGTPIFAVSFSVGGLRVNKEVRNMREIKRRNIVTQSLDYSCGAAGLSTLLHYYHGDAVSEKDIIATILQFVPLEKIKERKGFSLLDLKNFAQTKGYKVTGYKMDMDFLRKLGKPVLVPIKFKNYSHFVIVKAVLADRVFIADPAAGNMSMKIDKFKNIWTNGIGLIIEREKSSLGYALQVKNEDMIIADYKLLRRLVDQAFIRTAVFTNEY